MVILHAKIHNINQLCKHFGIFVANQGQNNVEFVANHGQELNIMCNAYSILHPPQIQFFQVFGILDNTEEKDVMVKVVVNLINKDNQ